MKRLSILFFLTYCTFAANSQKISISLFNSQKNQTFVITPVSGSYSIIAGDKTISLSLNQIVYISRSGDSIKVRDMVSNLGTWPRVSIIGQTDKDVIRMNSVVPSMPARVYDDNLTFYVDFDRLMTLNIIDLDKYIAGVVDAEAGPNAQPEFYKAQALLARTYALGHADKHMGEGFNLCDEVHCQAYKGKSIRNEKILKATIDTKGMVIVDEEKNLIVGAFHANCGGQTANSGDVWLTSHSYLTSVFDSYCKGLPSSQWEVRVPMEEWVNFLKSKGVNTSDLTAENYLFVPKERMYEYKINGITIPTGEIRSFFKLRSSFFSIDAVSNSIRIKGRGYGHGVGLCQDGAMQMAKRGKSYPDILHHYFKDVRIINYFETIEQDSSILYIDGNVASH